MAFKDFAETQFIQALDTGVDERMGGFTPVKNAELKHVRIFLYIQGVSSLGGSEKIRCVMHAELVNDSPVYTSSFSNISDITNLGSTNWLGFVRIDFNRENLNKNITYFPRIETSNYTRSGDAFFLGLSYDFPSPVYAGNTVIHYLNPLAMQWFHFIDRANQ